MLIIFTATILTFLPSMLQGTVHFSNLLGDLVKIDAHSSWIPLLDSSLIQEPFFLEGTSIHCLLMLNPPSFFFFCAHLSHLILPLKS